MSDATKPADEAAQAGRGVLYIAFAKIYFMVSGFVMEARLPHVLATHVFGAYGWVASAVSWVNNVLVTGTIQAISRFTAQRPEQARSVQQAGLRMHLLVGTPVALLFAAAAPLFAYFAHDMSKTGPLMLASVIPLAYSFYSVNVGTANGTRAFHKQAALDITSATLRVVGIIGLAGAFGLYGAIGGWVGAAIIILLLSIVVIGLPGRRPAGEPRQPLRPLLGFFASVAVYLVLLNLLMQIDQLLLKRLTHQWYAHHEGLTDVLAAKAADVQVAYYRAVQNLGRLSYQAIIAVMFVIFPLVSASTFADDRETTRRYIHTTMRYSLIFATAIAVAFAANPGPTIDILYPAEYAVSGAPALIAFALANVAFSIFAIVGTILNGAGRSRPAIIIAAITLGLAAVGNWIVIPRFEPGRDVLLACACTTGGAMLVGATLGGLVLRSELGAFLAPLTLIRVVASAGAAMAIGRYLPDGGPLMTMIEAGAVAVGYLVVLVLLGELGRADLAAVTRVARRGKGGQA
jgi:O-antigen/teichoic acid export membrane protein